MLEQHLALEFREILKNDGIQIIDLRKLMRALEIQTIEHIADYSYRKAHLCQNLKIKRSNLDWKLKRLEISYP